MLEGTLSGSLTDDNFFFPPFHCLKYENRAEGDVVILTKHQMYEQLVTGKC